MLFFPNILKSEKKFQQSNLTNKNVFTYITLFEIISIILIFNLFRKMGIKHNGIIYLIDPFFNNSE